jgi:hypothetical protein
MPTVKTPHHEIIAKRIRLERVELFARIAQAEKALRAMLGAFTKNVTGKVNAKGSSLVNLKVINVRLHREVVALRSSMRVWINALIRDGVKMGFRHPGDALKPVFKDNQEAVTEMIAEYALFEARLSFGLDSTFAKQAKPGIAASSAKWMAISQRIIKNVAKKNLQGLTVSERVWELTARTEQDLKRIIANGIAQGNSPYEISKRIETYVSPQAGAADELGIEAGPGVYRSPYKNAMRLARTETNRAYTQASANFYQNKEWVSEVDVTLSPDHDVEDDCDDVADAGPYPTDEADGLLPVHPHCVSGEMDVMIIDGMTALRSNYGGDIFEIGMSDGRRLSITANHMMLTRRGFIKAQFLMESDEIMDCSGIDRDMLRGPNNHGMPTRALDVFESLAKTRGVASAGVPVAAEHLHGDGRFCQGNIDIVGTDGLLLDNRDTQTPQMCSGLLFNRTYKNLPVFSGQSQLRHVLKTIGSAFPYPMRGLGIATSPFRTLVGQPKALSIRGGPKRDTQPRQPPGDCHSGEPDLLADMFDRFSGFVTATKIAFIYRHAVVALPVFDFHTDSSLYLVDGLISSNCMCSLTPRIDPQYLGEEEPTDEENQ